MNDYNSWSNESLLRAARWCRVRTERWSAMTEFLERFEIPTKNVMGFGDALRTIEQVSQQHGITLDRA